MIAPQTDAIDRAATVTRDFIERAAEAEEARVAVDFSLAAKNMAGALHSLIGAVKTANGRGA